MLRPPATATACAAALVATCAVIGGCSTVGDEGAADGLTADDPEVVVDEEYFPGVGTMSLDVQSYDVEAAVTIDGPDELQAEATLGITAVAQLDRVELDLRGLTVDTATIDGEPVPHRRSDDKVVLTPDEPIEAGRTFEATIAYRGEPSAGDDPIDVLEGGGGWVDLGAYSAVLAEPVGAATWLPVNDLPSDKATFAVEVTVPTPLEAVANGLLQGRTTDGAAGTTTFRWAAAEPMAPYLMTLVVGELELVDSQLADGTPVIDAWPPGTDPAVLAPLGRFGEMMDFLTDRLGAYPFGTAGNVVVPGLPPTALETQTRSVLSEAAMQGPDPDQLVVHELAHQWFGDWVTPATWADIWLNEGPAVYFQWSWAESQGGPTLEQSAQISWDAADASMDVPPADPGPDELFGRSVYERSAMFLIELELLMGEDEFDELLRTWLSDRAGGTGTTEQFLDLATRLHGDGIEIGALAEPWLFGDELPELSF